MKRKIAYIFTTAVISLTAFSIGKFTSESDTPDQKTTKTTAVETETAQEIKSIETTEYGMLITFGDETGVVIIPQSLFNEVMVQTLAVKLKEETIINMLKEGKSLSEITKIKQ